MAKKVDSARHRVVLKEIIEEMQYPDPELRISSTMASTWLVLQEAGMFCPVTSSLPAGQ